MAAAAAAPDPSRKDVTVIEPYVDNLAHLQGALLVLNLRLHRQILRWRAGHAHEATADELLGLYISEREVDALLDGLYAASAAPDADALDQAPIAVVNHLLEDASQRHTARTAASLAAGVGLRLPVLAQRLQLDAFEQEVVLLALAPELNRSYERLFGYLNDDIARRWPSIDLACNLFCHDLRDRVRQRAAFTAHRPLHALRLIHLSHEPTPAPATLLTRLFTLDERIVAFLLGDDRTDAVLEGFLTTHGSGRLAELPLLDSASHSRVEALREYLVQHTGPAPLISLIGPDQQQQLDVAHYLSGQARPGAALLALDGAALAGHPDPEDMVARALREARLDGHSLALSKADQFAAATGPGAAALRRLLAAPCNHLRFLLADSAWPVPHQPHPALLFLLELATPDAPTRQRLWAASLNGHAPDVDLGELAGRFRLTSGQIAHAARQAYTLAALRQPGNGHLVARDDIFASCRSQAIDALDGLAQRIDNIYAWDDLVLPPQIKQLLRGLEHWMRYRHVVFGEWGYSQRVMLGRGLAVLFSGPSGTGKTMAAGIMARNLELDIYRVDLSTVVSKYIGETEKNLSRIFAAAESANAILFFDEADALFGKRSDVKDAHDRYANIEVSYLLQRMEAYDGMAILATNFRQNLDAAFARRLQITVEFPFPQASDRERIWRQLLPQSVPQAADVDLIYLASQFALTGGNIKNSVLTAAFSAAAEGSPIGMRHLVRAVSQELSKMDQPVTRADFGPYYELI